MDKFGKDVLDMRTDLDRQAANIAVQEMAVSMGGKEMSNPYAGAGHGEGRDHVLDARRDCHRALEAELTSRLVK
eukprot:1518320-Pyramimonas_sp.AAC.1